MSSFSAILLGLRLDKFYQKLTTLRDGILCRLLSMDIKWKIVAFS